MVNRFFTIFVIYLWMIIFEHIGLAVFEHDPWRTILEQIWLVWLVFEHDWLIIFTRVHWGIIIHWFEGYSKKVIYVRQCANIRCKQYSLYLSRNKFCSIYQNDRNVSVCNLIRSEIRSYSCLVYASYTSFCSLLKRRLLIYNQARTWEYGLNQNTSYIQ